MDNGINADMELMEKLRQEILFFANEYNCLWFKISILEKENKVSSKISEYLKRINYIENQIEKLGYKKFVTYVCFNEEFEIVEVLEDLNEAKELHKRMIVNFSAIEREFEKMSNEAKMKLKRSFFYI